MAGVLVEESILHTFAPQHQRLVVGLLAWIVHSAHEFSRKHILTAVAMHFVPGAAHVSAGGRLNEHYTERGQHKAYISVRVAKQLQVLDALVGRMMQCALRLDNLIEDVAAVTDAL